MKEDISVEEMMTREPVVNGFRKGITKKKLFTSLTQDDWLHLDNVKAAEECMTNANSYAMFIKADQAVQNKNSIEYQVRENVCSLKQLGIARKTNDTKALLGESNDEKMVPEELVVVSEKMRIKQLRYVDLIRADLARLYSFVGKQGLDRKKFYTEDDWNGLFEDCVREVRREGFEL